MSQTATASSIGQALHIDNYYDIESNNAILDLIKGNELASSGDLKIFDSERGFYEPHAIFYYGDRLRISFRVRPQYAGHFILIKGLLEFHRSGNFAFSYRRSDASFDATINTNHAEDLSAFLKTLSGWLDQEIRYKSVLKTVLEFERSYKSRMAEVYALQAEALRPI